MYRKRVGEAIIEKHDLHDDYPDWDKRWSGIDRDRSEVRDEEYIMERRVSAYIREQPFLWVKIDDEPSADSDRAYVESNAIVLLSIRGNRVQDTQVQRAVRQGAVDAGIMEEGETRFHRKFTPHTFRTVFTTLMRNQGMSDHVLQYIRGDANSKTMDIYKGKDYAE